jgi:hypothetical protein
MPGILVCIISIMGSKIPVVYYAVILFLICSIVYYNIARYYEKRTKSSVASEEVDQNDPTNNFHPFNPLVDKLKSMNVLPVKIKPKPLAIGGVVNTNIDPAQLDALSSSLPSSPVTSKPEALPTLAKDMLDEELVAVPDSLTRKPSPNKVTLAPIRKVSTDLVISDFEDEFGGTRAADSEQFLRRVSRDSTRRKDKKKKTKKKERSSSRDGSVNSDGDGGTERSENGGGGGSRSGDSRREERRKREGKDSEGLGSTTNHQRSSALDTVNEEDTQVSSRRSRRHSRQRTPAPLGELDNNRASGGVAQMKSVTFAPSHQSQSHAAPEPSLDLSLRFNRLSILSSNSRGDLESESGLRNSAPQFPSWHAGEESVSLPRPRREQVDDNFRASVRIANSWTTLAPSSSTVSVIGGASASAGGGLKSSSVVTGREETTSASSAADIRALGARSPHLSTAPQFPSWHYN